MVLAKITVARQQLMEAQTIEEVLELRDQAAAVIHYVKQRDYSLDAQNDAIDFKLDAERKLGELTREMEKAKGAATRLQDVTTLVPTYSALGLNKVQVHRWQQAADLPEEVYQRYKAETRKKGDLLTSDGVRRLAKYLNRQKPKSERSPVQWDDLQHSLLHGDFKAIAPTLGQFDAIITDIPYNTSGLVCARQLAEWTPRLLPLGGTLVVMCGQFLMMEVYQIIHQTMNYRWTMAYLTPGGESPQIWPVKVNTFWKPVFVFSNGYTDYARWLGDVIKSDANDKRFHEWGQSEGGFEQIIEKLTEPGDHVLDPFMGAGTTGVAALSKGRHFTGVDVDADAVAAAIRRIGDGIDDAG